MRHDKLISADNCTVMVVDIQEAFVPHIRRLDKVIERTLMMIRAAQLLDVPIIVTEQYPKGLGRTVKPVREALGEIEYHEKLSFSCCQEPTVRTALAAAKREQLILVGIEAHVCIAQTALDAVAMGWGGLWATLLGELAGKELAGTASAASASANVLGIMVGPVLFGYIVDTQGSYQIAWLFPALLGALSVVFLSLVREHRRRT